MSPRAGLLAVVLIACGLIYLNRHRDPDQGASGSAIRPSIRLDGMPKHIVDRIYTLGEDAGAGTSRYLIVSEDGLVLVDTGFISNWPETEGRIRRLGFDPAKIRHVLITHGHVDHVQAANLVREKTGAKIYVGEGDVAHVEKGGLSDLLLGGWPGVEMWRVPPTKVDVVLKDGDVLAIPGVSIKALATPGHTPGSICYSVAYDGGTADGGGAALLSGDIVMSRNPSPADARSMSVPERYGGDVEAALRTVARLRGEKVDALLVGHASMDQDREDDGQGGRARLGADPFLDAAGWKARLDALEEYLLRCKRRLDEDGRDFLDDRPRSLHPGLLYLGKPGGAAVAALETATGLVLVDPGPAGSAAELWKRIEGLGYGPERLRAVLITRAGPGLAGVLAELLDRSPSSVPVYCGHAERAQVGGLVETIGLFGGEGVEIDGLQVQTRAAPGRSPGHMAYYVRLQGKGVVFTGDLLAPPTAIESAGYTGYRPPAPADPGAYARSLMALQELDVAIWISPDPWKDRNANLYEGGWHNPSWPETLGRNMIP